MAEFLESGGFDTHLRDLRVALWRAVDAAREEVFRTFPSGTRVSLPEGGFVAVGAAARRLRRRGRREPRRVGRRRILPGAAFSANLQYRNYIRIACGYPVDILRPAVRTIARLLTM